MSSLNDFLKLVASELGGTTRTAGGQIELVLPGRDEIVIDPDEDQKSLSRERLLLIEKQAAIVLLNPPVLFGAEVENKKAGQNRRTILRVAFGYQLVNAHPCFRRYTSYFEPTSKRKVTIRGDDNLFARHSSPLREHKSDFSLIQQHIGEVSRQVGDVYDDFLIDQQVKNEIRAISDRRSGELFELDLLYNRNSQRHLRTYGVNPERPWEKPSSPADEFRRKRAVVYQRHVPLVSLKILSVGAILSPVEGKKDSLRLPFLDAVPKTRWLTL